MAKKPPRGLKPIAFHREERFIEVCAAMTRYYSNALPIPIEWVEEYNDLVTKIKFKQ